MLASCAPHTPPTSKASVCRRSDPSGSARYLTGLVPCLAPFLLPPVSLLVDRYDVTAHTCTDSASVPQCVTKCLSVVGDVTPVDEHCPALPGRVDRPASAARPVAARRTVADERGFERRPSAGPIPAATWPSKRWRPTWRPSAPRSASGRLESVRRCGGERGGAGATLGGRRAGLDCSGPAYFPTRARPRSSRWRRWPPRQRRVPRPGHAVPAAATRTGTTR
jgi:hypothetical protein